MPLTLIGNPHGVNFFAESVLFILLPLPFIPTTIHIVMNAVARDVVGGKLSNVFVTIVPREDTLAVHLVLQILTLVHVSFFVDFTAHAILFVVSPVAFLNLTRFRNANSPPLEDILPLQTLPQIHRPITRVMQGPVLHLPQSFLKILLIVHEISLRFESVVCGAGQVVD